MSDPKMLDRSRVVSRRQVLRAIAGGSAVMLAAACGQQPTPTAKPAAPAPTTGAATAPAAAPAARNPLAGATLNVIVMTNPQSEKLKQVYLSPEFAKNTGVKVNINQFSWDENRPKVLADFNTKTGGFDLLYLDVSWLAEYAELGILSPLEGFQENKSLADPAFDVPDFHPKLMDIVARWKGKLYTLPYASDAAHLIYRKDLFEDPKEVDTFKAKHGRELRPPETFDEFRVVAEFFTRDTDNDGKVDLFGTTTAGKAGSFIWNRWRQYLYAFGGDVVDETYKPTFNTPQSIESMEFYRSLRKFMPPGAPSMTGGEAVKVFTDGRAAMMIEWSAYAPQLGESSIASKLGWMGMPKQKREASGNAGDSLGVYSLSKQRDAAYKLLEWLLGKEGMRTTASLGVTPGRLSLLKDPELQAKWPHLKSFLSTYDSRTVVPDPKTVYWDKMREIIGTAVSEAFVSDAPVKPVFDRAQGELEQVVKS